MSPASILSSHRLPSWLARLAATPATRAALVQDAFTFASWYCLAEPLISWPEPVRSIQMEQAERKLSLEQTLELLRQFNTGGQRMQVAGPRQARQMLEGYAVHDWVAANARLFEDLTGRASELFGQSRASGARQAAAQQGEEGQDALSTLSRVLALSELEADILAFVFLHSYSQELQRIFTCFDAGPWLSKHLWTTVFSANQSELEKALRPSSGLRLSGLLLPSADKTVPARLSEFWQEMFLRENLFSSVLEPLKPRRSAGVPARLLDEDLELAANVVRNTKAEPGANLLLYGAPALDKYQLLRDVVRKADRQAWRIPDLEDAFQRDRASLVYVAQRLLAAEEPNSVLVVERPADALTSAPSELLKHLFGIELDATALPAFEEHLLSTNQVPTIWLASSTASLPDETVARFVFHAPLKKADRKERQAQLEELLVQHKLTKKAREAILKVDGVSAIQLESALKVAAMTCQGTRTERDAVVVQAIRRSQRALRREVGIKFKESVTQYSLNYLNTAGRFSPENILQAFKSRPVGAMVLYGPPGTGKTQFVEYMASELGRPLVAKRASDLLSKWLGESEKNIAAAFEEAAAEDAILLLDEGDSFLRDRSQARESWQITQVNELLQHIERFEGIVVVCTNLFQGLDAAALRRFTFKVEFRELDADQRWEMFQVEAGLKGKLSAISQSTRDAWFEQLCLMRRLTPGDFATVKRQCRLMGVELTPQEWLDQLQLECNVKRQDEADTRRMG